MRGIKTKQTAYINHGYLFNPLYGKYEISIALAMTKRKIREMKDEPFDHVHISIPK